MRKFELFRVVGSGSVQELICQTIELPQAAEEIKDIRKTVIIDNCRVIFDKVIIDGRLRKDIMFKAANAGLPQPGTVQGCGGVVASVSGAILDLDVDIAFTALIPVPGACPDDHCVVLDAFVEGEKEEAANLRSSGAFTALIDKSVVFICVKVVRDVVTGLDTDYSGDDQSEDFDESGSSGKEGQYGKKPRSKKHHSKSECGDRDHSLCPKRRSTGVHSSGRIPAPRPGMIPGTWIGPTLLFDGFLNPGIPALSPLSNIIVNPTGSQIQLTDGHSGHS